MLDGVDLVGELDAELDAAYECVKDITRLRFEAAEKEREYRIAKRQRTLFERDHNKTPVTLIADIVCGYEDIAQLRFERDCAQAVCDANYEAILFHKKKSDAIREQIGREWAQSARSI